MAGGQRKRSAKALSSEYLDVPECKKAKMEDKSSSLEDGILNTAFCLQIAHRVGVEKAEQGSNFVLSPISIHACLSLLAVGSTGKTLDQLLFYLKSNTLNDLNDCSSRILKLLSPQGEEGPVLSFANSVWVDKTFSLKTPFKQVARRTHGAKAKNVDFENKPQKAVQKINSWVETTTNGLIKELIRSINKDVIVVLANALYFKGVWTEEFDKHHTIDKAFHLLNRDTIQVPFMRKLTSKHSFRAFDGFKVVKLSYQRGLHNTNLAMYILLPEEKNGLMDLIRKSNTTPGFLSQDFKLEKEKIDELAIPKFRFSSEFEGSKAIKEQGLVLPFLDTGDISDMANSADGLYVSKVLQKSYVEVNEKGTKAAAATALRMVFSCYHGYKPPPRRDFIADHPFMFMIREETSRMVLFIGAVLNPSTS